MERNEKAERIRRKREENGRERRNRRNRRVDEVIIEGRREIGEGTFEYVASGAIEGRKSLIDNDVSSENAQYSNEDDVLYFSENSVLLRYPPRKKMPRFEHPTKTNGI